MNKLGDLHIIHCISPVDTAAVAASGDVVDCAEAHELEFLVLLGTITGDTVVVTVRECDDTTPTNSTAIAFSYQKGAALGTDTMGEVTAATTSGVTMSATDDDKILRCFVNPASFDSGYRYARVVVTPGGSMSACEIAAIAILRKRYPQEVPASAVD